MTQIKYADHQQIISAIKEKYHNTKVLSRDEHSCNYGRKINGTGCAIGCLIDDEKMSTQLDNLFHGRTIRALHSVYGDIVNTIPQLHYTSVDTTAVNHLFEKVFNTAMVDIAFLMDVQSAHDTAESVDDFISKLDEIDVRHR